MKRKTPKEMLRACETEAIRNAVHFWTDELAEGPEVGDETAFRAAIAWMRAELKRRRAKGSGR